jgi:hypothetical protein
MRWKYVPKQSCLTHSQNSATAFLLGQSGILAISCFHGFGDNFVSSSFLCTIWNTCFKCSLIELLDVSLICVCVMLAPFLPVQRHHMFIPCVSNPVIHSLWPRVTQIF